MAGQLRSQSRYAFASAGCSLCPPAVAPVTYLSFTLAAALTLAVGIGANSAIFSLLYQSLLRSLPVQSPGQLVELRFAGAAPGHTHSEGGDTPEARAYFSYPIYRDLRDQCHVFNGLIAFATAQVGFTWNNQSDLVPAEIVSGNYFSVLGVQSALGRLFLPSDDTTKDGNPVAVLSYNYWSVHLGSDPNILNKTVGVNGSTVELHPAITALPLVIQGVLTHSASNTVTCCSSTHHVATIADVLARRDLAMC